MDEPIAGKLFWRINALGNAELFQTPFFAGTDSRTLTLGAFATPCQAPQGKPGGNTTRRTNDLLLVQLPPVLKLLDVLADVHRAPVANLLKAG
jgi:hypothetical protein